MRREATLPERALAGISVVLSAVAGYVDAFGWALFANVYMANMSGNTIALGRGLAQHDLAEAAARVWPVLGFTLGILVSELAYEEARRRGRRSSAGWTLGLEAIAIAIVMWLPGTRSARGLAYYVPTGLLTLAMGLQNATLVRIGASSVYTTHVTGNLTRLAREATHALTRRQPQSRRRVVLMTALWLAYAIGAVLGAAATMRWGHHAAVFAVVVLAALVVLDNLEPIGGHEAPADPHPMF